MLDIEKLESILDNYGFTKVYSGQDSGCRCGCNGKYYYPKDEGFATVMSKAIMRIAENGAYFGDGWVNVSYGDDMAYTIYYDDGSQKMKEE